MFAARPIHVGRILIVVAILWVSLISSPRAHGAGVTLITHGFSGNADGWVLGMAGKIRGYPRFPGTNVINYEVSVSSGFAVTARKVAGGHPTNDPTADPPWDNS